MTAIGLPQSAPPSLTELVAELREWITEDATGGRGGRAATPENPEPASGQPAHRGLRRPGAGPAARRPGRDQDTRRSSRPRLAEPHRPARARRRSLAAPYEDVAAWFEQLEAVVGELMERAAGAGARPARTEYRAGVRTAAGDGARLAGHAGARRAVLPALRSRVVRPPSRRPRPAARSRPALGARAPTSALGCSPRSIRGSPTGSTRRGGGPPRPCPPLLRELQAMRVTAAPFGATAPLKPVQDDRGRVIRQADWPLTGAALTTMRVVYDTAGRVPVRAEFQHIETGSSVQRAENLPARDDLRPGAGPGRADDPLRPGPRSELAEPAPRRLPGARRHRPAAVRAARADAVRVPARRGRAGSMSPCTTASRSNWRLAPGDHEQITHGGLRGERAVHGRQRAGRTSRSASRPCRSPRTVVSSRWTPSRTASRSAAGSRSSAPARAPRAGRHPGRQEAGVRHHPGHRRAHRRVHQLRHHRPRHRARRSPTRGWTSTTSCSRAIRDTTVHAGGEALRLADEPLGEDVHGNELELAELYDGLRPGRHLVVVRRAHRHPRHGRRARHRTRR